MTAEQKAKMDKAMNEAIVVREFVAHPGMKLLVEQLKTTVKSKENAWLNAPTPEEAEKIRQDSRAYAALSGILNQFLVRGQQAERAMKSNTEPVQ